MFSDVDVLLKPSTGMHLEKGIKRSYHGGRHNAAHHRHSVYNE